MNDPHHRRVLALTIILVIAVIIAAIYILSRDGFKRSAPTETAAPTHDNIEEAIEVLKVDTSPLKDLPASKQQQTLDSLKASSSTPKINQSALDQLKAK